VWGLGARGSGLAELSADGGSGLRCCSLLLASFFASASGSGCDRCISRNDALTAATEAVRELSVRERLDATRFVNPEVRFQERDRVWMFNYIDNRGPQLLTATVSCGGRVELSRLEKRRR